MPIYEYKCQKCNYQFEKLVWGEEKTKCPKCGSENLKKLISGFSVGQPNNSSSENSESCEGGTCDVSCPTCGN